MAICDESKPFIFISYSHRDSDIVFSIIDRLRTAGFNVWYDGGIDPGTEWDENIASHVQKCTYFIAFVSEGYIGSNNCKDELNYSRDLNKNQLLVYLEDVNLPGGMAMRMNRIQAIWYNKYNTANISEFYEKLFNAHGIHDTRINAPAEQSSEQVVPSQVVQQQVVPQQAVPQQSVYQQDVYQQDIVTSADPSWPLKNKKLAILLAVVLGILGIHKFYLGDNKMGCIYLIFFWTTIPFFLGIIDGIKLYKTDNSELELKYHVRLS